MNRLARVLLNRSVALGVILMLAGATSALAQRGGGRGGYSGPGFSSGYRGYGGGRGYGSNWGYGGPSFRGGRGYNSFGSFGRGYDRGFAAGRFYPGRGYFYGNRFWARPYFGVGVGIPFGYGYYSRAYGPRCGFVDGWGYWQPAPCWVNPYGPY